jgi:hypothetical protein
MDQHYHNLAKIDNFSKIDKNGKHLPEPQSACHQMGFCAQRQCVISSGSTAAFNLKP